MDVRHFADPALLRAAAQFHSGQVSMCMRLFFGCQEA